MSQVVKVGIFATVCLVILAVLIWKIEDFNPFAEEGRRVDATFDSVAGLDDKASVRVAGVRVGRVDGVALDGRKARVTLFLEQPIPLTEGSYARVSSLGLLGEKYIEILPGPAGAPPLPPGAVLPGVTPPSLDEAVAKINDIGTSIQQMMTGTLGGGANLGDSINRLIADFEATSRELRMVIAENRANLSSTIENANRASATLAQELPRLADQMDRTLRQIEALVADNRGNVSESLASMRQVTDRLQTSADNFNEISGKIARGEGTIGKLVNDEKAYDEVLSTLDSIQGGVENLSGTFGAINRFRFDLDLQAYYLPDQDGYQTNLLLDIDPQDNARLYRGGISSPPQGKRREKTQTITVTNPDGTTEVTTVNTITNERAYLANGLFGFRAPRDVRVFAGLIENSGGAQVEVPLFKDRFLVSFEAFDFNRPQELSPHLRLTGRWRFHPNLYLVGGYDDALENSSYYLGGGIRWNDENIKYLLGAIPFR